MQKKNLKFINEIKIKIVLVGDKEVGKSTFLQRFAKFIKILNLESNSVLLQIRIQNH